VDFGVRPVLAEDFLSERLVFAEDVSDPPHRPDPFRREREPADAGEEVEVDFFIVHKLFIKLLLEVGAVVGKRGAL
jgi:hypothetical protein